ncbi:imidazoleglycerol-phosphate dehydratase HisB [Rickettsiales bacterium]|jgi:imidazoleglycerol-phosphate dehydratase|nr:imidazoleglycerol-phosphate dehydratase HisB [Rickettsiales bacterium]|tara:strand:- start:25692 stop:26279 length:588 start_codon:yes stop_codon:yes gene_type:complete
MRIAEITRDTKETKINVSINLDGQAKYQIDTGIGFLNHMIEQLSHHSLIDINLKCQGDLNIDFHHTTEDCGIAIGQAINKALGDKKGINRFGHSYVPMDETLSRCVIDLSGRAYTIFNCEFKRDKVGEMDCELFREFFHALAQAIGCNLHIENLYGINNHHIIESCFKALARALREAITIDDRKKNIINSTKGIL